MIGVAFPSFRIPEHRLRDHFDWNESLYVGDSARVFPVTDTEYEVPAYAECVVFPEDRLPVINRRRRFATTRCRNAGIQAAIRAGCCPIIVTDVDMAFELEAWQAMIKVSDSETPVAEVPACRMSNSSQLEWRAVSWLDAPVATGTISMRAAEWGRVSYCEKQWAYGCDDGLILTRISDAGIRIQRTGFIYHMAHVEGANQKEFDGRDDHWNRANGFNPDNFQHNLKF